VPLQAGHISSTTSDLIDFIMRAALGSNYQSGLLTLFRNFAINCAE